MRHSKLLNALLFCAVLGGCKNRDPIQLQPTIEEPPHLANMIRTGDPAVSSQLLSGFGAIEDSSWRWTGPHFAVALGVPPAAHRAGASVVLAFTLPEISVKTLKSIQLSGSAGNVVFKRESYDSAGAHSYRRDIPAALLESETLRVRFDADKYLQPQGDHRQLSLIVTSVQLEPK